MNIGTRLRFSSPPYGKESKAATRTAESLSFQTLARLSAMNLLLRSTCGRAETTASRTAGLGWPRAAVNAAKAVPPVRARATPARSQIGRCPFKSKSFSRETAAAPIMSNGTRETMPSSARISGIFGTRRGPRSRMAVTAVSLTTGSGSRNVARTASTAAGDPVLPRPATATARISEFGERRAALRVG